MIVTPYSTPKVVAGNNLIHILDASLPKLKQKDIVVITSKIISICQGRVVKNDGTVDKRELIRKEAEKYIEEPSISRFHVTLTIKEGILIANSGIDESNANGVFVLWPKDVFKVAQELWRHLRKKHALNHLGILITDSRLVPLRWGTLGIALAWCGFEPLKDYIGKPDIFGRKLRVTKQNIIDGLAAAAGAVMGEGNEQTPLAVIREVPFVRFQDRPPTQREIDTTRINLSDDMYAPLIDSPKWKRGVRVK